jgi:hypothetical protein
MHVRIFRTDGMSGSYDGWQYHGMTAEEAEKDAFIVRVEEDIANTAGMDVRTLEYRVTELEGTVPTL